VHTPCIQQRVIFNIPWKSSLYPIRFWWQVYVYQGFRNSDFGKDLTFKGCAFPSDALLKSLASGISSSALLLPNYSLIAAFMAEIPSHRTPDKPVAPSSECVVDGWFTALKFSRGSFPLLCDNLSTCVMPQVVPRPVCGCLLSRPCQQLHLVTQTPPTNVCWEFSSRLSSAASSAVFCRCTQSSVALTPRTETCNCTHTLLAVPQYLNTDLTPQQCELTQGDSNISAGSTKDCLRKAYFVLSSKAN